VLCVGLQFNPQYKCTGACAQQVYDKMFKTAAGALAAATACLHLQAYVLLCCASSAVVLPMSRQGPPCCCGPVKTIALVLLVCFAVLDELSRQCFTVLSGLAWPALESCAGPERRSADAQAAPSPRAWAPCRATGSPSRWWTPWAASPSSTWVRGHRSVSDHPGFAGLRCAARGVWLARTTWL